MNENPWFEVTACSAHRLQTLPMWVLQVGIISSWRVWALGLKSTELTMP